MSRHLILLALGFWTLLGCSGGSNSNMSLNTNTHAEKNSVSLSVADFYSQGNLAKSPAEAKFLPFQFPRFKRQTIQADENTTAKTESIQFDDSDADSDYKVAANPADVHYEIGPTIVNGTRVDPSAPIPYQLSIRFHDRPPFGSWQHICGAVILDESTAITAAHCFDHSEDASRYRVTAGENILDVYEKNEQILGVKKIVIHPNYTDIRNGNDIAILHVDKIQLNEHVRGVWLSPFSTQNLSNLTGVISGWGQISGGSAVSNSLQKGRLSILSPQDCHRRLRRLRIPSAGILCALNPDTRACNGDSGGPLVIQNYKLPGGNFKGNLLVGIISFGARKCNLKNTAGFFTEISSFYDWIQEERAENPCEENHSPCVSGGCFHSDSKCNKNEDCADGTDEIECSGETPSSNTPEQSSITSCSVAMEILPSPRSKKQKIHPHGNGTNLKVLCDFETDGGGWTIIQKRTSGPKQEFQKNWKEYAEGFGSLEKNFWLGLENIHALTKNGDQELRIELEDFEGNKAYTKYSNFSVSDASDFYRLAISGFYGNSTAGDSMALSYFSSNGMRFSTNDKGNYRYVGNCTFAYGYGGWWFNNCVDSNLNGAYFDKGETVPSWSGVYWETWKGSKYSLAKTEIKIRTRK